MMASQHRFAALLICALLCAPSFAAADNEEASIQQAPCCFENPRFSGTCEVTPGEDESCSSILGYLNNPNSVGKVYCVNTKVRGGWSQVSCESGASATTSAACGDSQPRD
jgi:hypothetical protein